MIVFAVTLAAVAAARDQQLKLCYAASSFSFGG
jgi:hypothetical protein